MLRVCFVVALAFLPVVAIAGDVNHDGLETILLPIAFVPDRPVGGAFGTRWGGEVWLNNQAPQAVSLQLLVGCAAEEACSAQYPAHFVGRLSDPLDARADGGILLTPTAESAPLLVFSNRMFELTRHAQPQGFDLPVVREGQFLSAPTTLLGLPTTSAVRIAVRIYDPRRVPGTSFRLEVVASDGTVLAETTLVTTFESLNLHDLIRPGFAAIYDLTGAFPPAKAANVVYVRITPLMPGTEYWAMASVTDNDTQQVLIVTPQ